MKSTISILLGILLFATAPAFSQDGWFFNATPPIVVRGIQDPGGRNEPTYNFTNTSDKIIHGITLNWKNGQGIAQSRVIIDTIEPHKTETVVLDWAYVSHEIPDNASKDSITVTCTNYSKPLNIDAAMREWTVGGNSAKSPATKSLTNAHSLASACRQYASGHQGNFPSSLDSLFPTYLTDRSLLVSPLQPGEAAGYLYTPGLKDTGPVNAVVIEDKFAPLQHLRIVAYVDGSARVLNTP